MSSRKFYSLQMKSFWNRNFIFDYKKTFSRRPQYWYNKNNNWSICKFCIYCLSSFEKFRASGPFWNSFLMIKRSISSWLHLNFYFRIIILCSRHSFANLWILLSFSSSALFASLSFRRSEYIRYAIVRTTNPTIKIHVPVGPNPINKILSNSPNVLNVLFRKIGSIQYQLAKAALAYWFLSIS